MESLKNVDDLFEEETGLVACDANSDEYVFWLKKKVEMLYNLVMIQREAIYNPVFKTCTECNGYGVVTVYDYPMHSGVAYSKTCYRCGGAGVVLGVDV